MNNTHCDLCTDPYGRKKPCKVTGMSKLGIKNVCQECAEFLLVGTRPKKKSKKAARKK